MLPPLNSTYIQTAVDLAGNFYRFVCANIPTSCDDLPTCPDLIKSAYSLANLTEVANNNTATVALGKYECEDELDGFLTCSQQLSAYSSSNVTTFAGNIITQILNNANDICGDDEVKAEETGAITGGVIVLFLLIAVVSYCFRKQIVAKTQSCQASLYNLGSAIAAVTRNCGTILYNLSNFREHTGIHANDPYEGARTTELALLPKSSQKISGYGTSVHSHA